MDDNAIEYIPFEEAVIHDLLQRWHNQYPAMGVMALVPEAENQHIPLLQSSCQQFGVPLTGAVFPALVTDAGWRNNGCWLLRLNQQPPCHLFENIPDRTDTALDIATKLEPFLELANDTDKPTLFMMFDSMLPDVGTIVENLYLHLADSVHYAGINAGSETFQPMPCLFDTSKIIENGVWCMLLPVWAGMLLEHGYPAPDKVISATSAEGNRIISIDWQPAFDVYKQLVLEECGVALSADNFYQYACYFPLGILQANNEVVVRIPVAIHSDGSIVCVGDVPANTSLVLLHAPQLNESQCVKQICHRLQTDLPEISGWPLLTFYCAARRIHLDGDTLKELTNLKSCTGATKLVGALSLGEIGSRRIWGYPMFHSAALVCGSWKY